MKRTKAYLAVQATLANKSETELVLMVRDFEAKMASATNERTAAKFNHGYWAVRDHLRAFYRH